MAIQRQPLTDMGWLKKQIKNLEVTESEFKEVIAKIRKINPDIYNEFGAWTPLKLILLNYALDVCTTIISKSSYFKNMYYVDLFAGSGINKLKNKDNTFIGSPLIASLKYADKYTSMFFCENNPDFISTLKARLSILKRKNLIVIKGDCNLYLDRTLKEIDGQKKYSLFFIDPHAMEFSWESMEKVLAIRSDIIFTFMDSLIIREVASAKKMKERKHEKLTKFFGDDSWKNATNIDELAQIYKENILKKRPNAPIKIIKIKSKRYGFYYHMFFISSETKGGNPWLRAIDDAKRRIEQHSDKAVEMALEIIKKRQTELSQFSKR